MYVNEVTVQPECGTDSASPQQTSRSDNAPTISIENVINISRDGSAPSGIPKTVYYRPSTTSPTPSLRSTSISIASIESDAASSVIDSDIDEFEDTNTGCMVKKLGRQTTSSPMDNYPIPNINPEIGVLLGQQIERDVSSSKGPQIASLSLTNSTDVTFGHKRYHKGPVTIQQILMEKSPHNGSSNAAFESSNDCSSIAARTKEPEHAIHRDNPPPSQTYKNLLNHKTTIITAIIVILTLLIGIIVITTTFILKDGVLQSVGIIPFRMVSRDEWIAQPPNVQLDDLETPVLRVIITQTSTQNCTSVAMCIFRTRFIQTFDMESRSFDDIQYNFLVGGDGNVYIGRGWDKIGAHTLGYNSDSIGIAFIGTFNRWTPPEKQLNATKWLISEGVRLNKLESDYRLYGKRQFDQSNDPGDALYTILTKWPHWSSD